MPYPSLFPNAFANSNVVIMFSIGKTPHHQSLPTICAITILFKIGTKAIQPGCPALVKIFINGMRIKNTATTKPHINMMQNRPIAIPAPVSEELDS